MRVPRTWDVVLLCAAVLAGNAVRAEETSSQAVEKLTVAEAMQGVWDVWDLWTAPDGSRSASRLKLVGHLTITGVFYRFIPVNGSNAPERGAPPGVAGSFTDSSGSVATYISHPSGTCALRYSVPSGAKLAALPRRGGESSTYIGGIAFLEDRDAVARGTHDFMVLYDRVERQLELHPEFAVMSFTPHRVTKR